MGTDLKLVLIALLALCGLLGAQYLAGSQQVGATGYKGDITALRAHLQEMKAQNATTAQMKAEVAVVQARIYADAWGQAWEKMQQRIAAKEAKS